MIHKRENRGFSLVELIIVIAIMAILIGVLAPAYLRYVEKSRKSADADAIASYLNALETVVIEHSDQITSDAVIDLKVNNGILEFVTLRSMSDTDSITDIENALTEILGCHEVAPNQTLPGNYALKSQDWKTHSRTFLIMCKYTDNEHIKYTLDDFNGADTKLADYSPTLKAKIENSAK